MMLLVCATVVGLCCRRWFVLSLSDGVVAALCCGLLLNIVFTSKRDYHRQSHLGLCKNLTSFLLGSDKTS